MRWSTCLLAIVAAVNLNGKLRRDSGASSNLRSPCRYKDGRVGKIRTLVAEMHAPEADIAEFRAPQRLHFDPRLKGLSTYACKGPATVHEARTVAAGPGTRRTGIASDRTCCAIRNSRQVPSDCAPMT